MKYLLFVIAAVSAYLIAGINPSIIISKAVYGKDIRECGSKNPGFTNFKRCFGLKWAIVVMVIDLLKSALPSLVFGIIFGSMYGMRQIGIAFTCIFAMLGHAYPVWYKFRGGKGFLVCLSSMWILDWRVGLISTCIMVILLLTIKYMSLATMIAMLCCPFILLIFGTESIAVVFMCAACVLFMIYRHKQNIKRLISHTETKFSFKKSAK